MDQSIVVLKIVNKMFAVRLQDSTEVTSRLSFEVSRLMCINLGIEGLELTKTVD